MSRVTNFSIPRSILCLKLEPARCGLSYSRIPGETPPLRSGFAGLYRALGLPVVPVAVDSGLLWGRGLVKHSGIVTFMIGETIPAGLKREEIESRVHATINALESPPETRA